MAVTRQETRTVAQTAGAIIGVLQSAASQGQATATDAAGQFVAQLLQALDSAVHVAGKLFAQSLPVAFGRGAGIGQGCQYVANFCQGKPQILRDLHKGEAANAAARKPSLAA